MGKVGDTGYNWGGSHGQLEPAVNQNLPSPIGTPVRLGPPRIRAQTKRVRAFFYRIQSIEIVCFIRQKEHKHIRFMLDKGPTHMFACANILTYDLLHAKAQQ